ncbi:pyridoxal phosphate-dependent aminotransferase [Pandoraea anhela]|uniref:Aminotransferase n=1 Tax=Pandoraea anhela TaxID=2508295 RepID=A0A5E4WHB8_9BURK|nr:pyridoxal phosphate-dependent aminotransferase [Pandoraea anhela]VVE22994.1 aspartate aminotransferase [Pandoraea anhela]
MFAQRIGGIRPSPTLALASQAAELRKLGRDIVNMGVGEPDFDTPQEVCAAALDAMKSGETRYTPTAGTAVLRAAIARKLANDNDLRYGIDQIVVSNGAKQSIFNLVGALIDPGDEVIVPAPYWVSYWDVVTLFGGVPRSIECPIEDGFRLRADRLEASLTPATRLLFLNSPSNPSGAVYSDKELAAIGDVLRRYPKVWIVSDDIYEHILVGSRPFVNILNVCPDLADRTVIVNGVSKAFAMTGWRIGYSASSRALALAMETVQSQATGSPNAIAQRAAAEALDQAATLIPRMTDRYRQRHALMCGALAGIDGLQFRPAEGAFYLFAKVEDVIAELHRRGKLSAPTDVAFSAYLLEHFGLAVVPGSAFGLSGHLRMSFATSEKNIEIACQRLRLACAST